MAQAPLGLIDCIAADITLLDMCEHRAGYLLICQYIFPGFITALALPFLALVLALHLMVSSTLCWTYNGGTYIPHLRFFCLKSHCLTSSMSIAL